MSAQKGIGGCTRRQLLLVAFEYEPIGPLTCPACYLQYNKSSDRSYGQDLGSPDRNYVRDLARDTNFLISSTHTGLHCHPSIKILDLVVHAPCCASRRRSPIGPPKERRP